MMQPSTPGGDSEGGDWEILDGEGDDWDEWEHVGNTSKSFTKTTSPALQRCHMTKHTHDEGRQLFAKAVNQRKCNRVPEWVGDSRRYQKYHHYEPPSEPTCKEAKQPEQVQVPDWIGESRRHQQYHQHQADYSGSTDEDEPYDHYRLQQSQLRHRARKDWGTMREQAKVPDWIGESRRHQQYYSGSSDEDEPEEHYRLQHSQLHHRTRKDWGTILLHATQDSDSDSDAEMENVQKTYKDILMKERAHRASKAAKHAAWARLNKPSKGAKRTCREWVPGTHGGGDSYDTRDYDCAKSKGASRHAAAGDVSRKNHKSHGHTMRHRGRHFESSLVAQELTTDWRVPQKSSKKKDKFATPITAFESAEQDKDEFYKLGMGARTTTSASSNCGYDCAVLHQDPEERLQRHATTVSNKVVADHDVTQYSLKTVGYVTTDTRARPRPGDRKKKKAKETKFTFGGTSYNYPEPNTLYCIKPHSKHPLAAGSLTTDVPTSMASYERVSGSLRSRSHRHNHYQQAFCTQNHATTHWSAASEDNDREYLEYDLGEDRVVTGVSTKAKHPDTYAWPTPEMLEAEGYGTDGNVYKGPRFTVIDDEERGEWVERYELLGRADGGKKWHSIGNLRGNSDMSTEVAHSLAAYAPKGQEGLMLRYLRFRPLSHKESGFHRWKSMRVSVFGPKADVLSGAEGENNFSSGAPSKKQRKSKRLAAGGTHDAAAQAANDMGLPQSVTYTVYKAREGVNRRFGTRKNGTRKAATSSSRQRGHHCDTEEQRKKEKEEQRNVMKQGVKEWGGV